MSESFHQRAAKVLPAAVTADLERIGIWAGGSGAELFLVGGAVRDVMLGRSTADLDLVAVEVAPTAAADLARLLGGRVVARSQFGTWSIELPGGRRLDLAVARKERYHRPAQLPEVQPAKTLEEDLVRRDFAVNAMAVRLGSSWGSVIDPQHGLGDLATGSLRVLHSESFRDDPTRILRGLELAVRLGFAFEQSTAAAARRALEEGLLDRLSPRRWQLAWRRSFGRILAAGNEAIDQALMLANELGLWRALDSRPWPGQEALGSKGFILQAGAPEWVGPAAYERARALAKHCASARFREAGPDVLFVRALAWEHRQIVTGLARRWGLGETESRAWIEFAAALSSVEPALDGRIEQPSALRRFFARFGTSEMLLLEACGGPRLALSLARYRAEVEPLRLTVTGHDLIAAGCRPGPALGAALERTLDARLDGEIPADEELQYACREVERLEG